MIFRKTPEAAPARQAMNTAQRPAAPTQQAQGTSFSNATPAHMPSTQSSAAPMSPLAAAQARRSNAPANFMRQEQLRKLTVGRDISLNGEITTCDHLIVEGTVKATIKGGQILEISECGAFSGLVDIEQADIAGAFDGDLTVRGKLTVRPTAILSGNIQYGQLQVDSGARINGQINALPQAVAMDSPVQQTYAPTSYSSATTTNTGNLGTFNDEPGFLKASA